LSELRNHRPTSAGFTLLELLAACVLASLIALVTTRLMRTSLSETKFANTIRQPMVNSVLFREQLNEDIINARAFLVLPDRFILGGYLSRDPKTAMPTQQMSVVTYQIVALGKRKVLERQELRFQPDGRPITRREVVWDGISSFVAIPRAELISGSAFIFPELEAMQLKPMLDGLSVRMFDEKGRLFLEIL
jgi:hypothetical protein